METLEKEQLERQETAYELLNLLRVAQAMAQRLATETHGELYLPVKELGDLLHQARAQAFSIRQKLNSN